MAQVSFPLQQAEGLGVLAGARVAASPGWGRWGTLLSPAQPWQHPGLQGLTSVSLQKPSIRGGLQPVREPPLLRGELVNLLLGTESPDVVSGDISVGSHWLEHPNQRSLSYNRSFCRF